MLRILLPLLLLPCVALAQLSGGGIQPGGPVDTNTSGSGFSGFVSRTLTSWFGDQINIKAAGAKGDGTTDDTAAFTAAFTACQSATFGCTIKLVNGDYVLSSALSATIGANQRIVLLADGQHGARLHFTSASSAGIAMTLAPVTGATWISNGPSVAVENVTFVSDWSTTTAQTALAVAVSPGGTNPTTYARPLPQAVAVRNVTTISKTNSGGFARLLALTNVATSKFENIHMWASAGDTTAGAVTVAATSSTTSTGLRFDGLRQQNGGTALTITDYIQGVYVTDMQTVGTQHSISWTNPGGYTGADSLIVHHSQLNSALSEIDTTGVSHVQVEGNYLLAGGAGWHGISVTGSFGHTIVGNALIFGSGDATGYGIQIASAGTSVVNDNTLYGLLGATATTAPIILSGTTNASSVQGNTSEGSYVAWDSSTAHATNVILNNVGAVGGSNNNFSGSPSSSGTNLAYAVTTGPDANVQVILKTKGLPGVDFNAQDGLGRTLLQLNDSQNSGSGNGVTIASKPSGSSVVLGPRASTDNIALGTAGALATTATGGMIQIPYMAGAPTGTPATTGGATMVYNTASHSLNIYDPVAAGWYHVTLTAGAG